MQVDADLARQAGGQIYTFYAQRSYRPLWFNDQGTPDPAVAALLQYFGTAEYDGIDPRVLNVGAVTAALDQAAQQRTPAAIFAADLQVSRAFATYVRTLRSSADSTMLYEHDSLRPHVPSTYYALADAARAPVLSAYVSEMKWMHPLYASLRETLAQNASLDPRARQAAIATLARLRGIPSEGRQVLVDVANARLWMYEDGRPVDSMKVVVGKAETQTPFMAGYIRYAIFNPYWNVPANLVTSSIAKNVLSQGIGYLKYGGYQVLSDWSDNPSVVDPHTVDWHAAARGELDLRVRQLPRGRNFMGRVKFEFPNQQGIYLHDTPDKNLMLKDARQFSNGCIRLEDAERLGQWLMRGTPDPQSDTPELKVDLPQPVPIYVTYLTARAEQGHIALGPDPYGVDAANRPALALGPDRQASLSR